MAALDPVVSNPRAVDILTTHLTKRYRAFDPNSPDQTRPHEPTVRAVNFSLAYLDAFGYLTKELAEWQNIELEDILMAIGEFQNMIGLGQTETLDVATVRTMSAPRCGCPDVVRESNAPCVRAVQNRIASSLPRWQKTGLGYFVAAWPQCLDEAAYRKAVQAAFDGWSRFGDISAKPVDSADRADVLFDVGRGAASNFDGPGGTLAWAFLPTGNDSPLTVKLDLDEAWCVGEDGAGPKTRVENVLGHEVGHTLGLIHSRVPTAFMAPIYSASVRAPQDDDDVARLVERYGPAKEPVRVTAPPPAQAVGGVDFRVEGVITSIKVNGKEVSVA